MAEDHGLRVFFVPLAFWLTLTSCTPAVPPQPHPQRLWDCLAPAPQALCNLRSAPPHSLRSLPAQPPYSACVQAIHILSTPLPSTPSLCSLCLVPPLRR